MRDIKSLERKVNLNTALLFIFRLTSISISFLLVPLLINYLDTNLYGIWLTILSITYWIMYFDVGIGNGLRNKLTESLTKRNTGHSKSLISTAYVLIIIISVVALIVFFLISRIISWNMVFNVEEMFNPELESVMTIVIMAILFNFILSLNNHVAFANQEASLTGFRELIFQSFLITGVLTLLITSKNGSLLNLAIIYFCSISAANIFVMLYIFNKYRNLIPSLKHFQLNNVKALLSLGFEFFIIQIAALVIFSTDNLLIIHIIGSREVATYNVMYQLFSPIIFIHSVLVTPLWSAFTKSFEINDFIWIKKTFHKLAIYSIILTLSIMLIALLTEPIILLWLNDQSFYYPPLVAAMAIYIFVIIWNSNFASFLNGISKIRPQVCTAIVGATLNIPVSILLARELGLGSTGVVLGSIISLSFFALVGPLQTIYILKKKNVISSPSL